jgi:hypothetical protein
LAGVIFILRNNITSEIKLIYDKGELFMYVAPQNGRAIINNIGDGLKINIPIHKNIFMILVVSIWLCGWFFGEVSAIWSLFFNVHHSNVMFISIWLCGWTMAGGYVLASLLWNIAGREVVTVQKEMIKIERKIFNIGLNREYSTVAAKNFRVVNQDNSITWFRWKNNFGCFTGTGKIKFDYGMKTLSFGIGIDEAEGSYILAQLKESGCIN